MSHKSGIESFLDCMLVLAIIAVYVTMCTLAHVDYMTPITYVLNLIVSVF